MRERERERPYVSTFHAVVNGTGTESRDYIAHQSTLAR